MRRHPDIKFLRRPSDFTTLAKQQLALLQQLWPLLADEGILLYATCSIMSEENEQVIDRFLQNNPSASLIQSLRLRPSMTNDGFYYAKLQKNRH